MAVFRNIYRSLSKYLWGRRVTPSGCAPAAGHDPRTDASHDSDRAFAYPIAQTGRPHQPARSPGSVGGDDEGGGGGEDQGGGGGGGESSGDEGGRSTTNGTTQNALFSS